MQITFESIEEVRDFVKTHLKGSRGKVGDKEDGDTTTGAAPAPLMPPQGQQVAFQPTQQPAFSPPQGGFPGSGAAPGVDPATQAIVARINTRIDGAITSGQPADAVLTWFRTQCGAEAANATMDQIKQSFLPKLPMASLENIAKLMNA